VARPAIAILVAAAALAATAASAAAQETLPPDPEPQTTLPDVEDEVMCPVCGVPLELATEAPQANEERDLIRKAIAQGKTKDEIKDELVAQYGEQVLAVPGDEGFDLAAWLVPGAAILVAAAAIFVALRRWRRRGDGPGGEREKALDPDDAERLDSDLARYEL
jgi:cytochrome c-type biogenesis protein CcmH/NrfF